MNGEWDDKEAYKTNGEDTVVSVMERDENVRIVIMQPRTNYS